MSAAPLRRPRLVLPFTVIPDGDTVHLIAGEDVRYSVYAAAHAPQAAEVLKQCDGHTPLETLLRNLPESARSVTRQMIERLYGERIVGEGPTEAGHVAADYAWRAEGCGPLVERLNSSASEGRALSVLCQDRLDHHAALAFNRRQLEAADGPWLWVTTGPLSRGYVSPVFLPRAGPCLACLLGHFRRLSPAARLYDVLLDHGRQGGEFAAVDFPASGLAILEQVVLWKAAQLRLERPPAAVFRLHVLELETLETRAHRVPIDPTCPECRAANVG